MPNERNALCDSQAMLYSCGAAPKSRAKLRNSSIK